MRTYILRTVILFVCWAFLPQGFSQQILSDVFSPLALYDGKAFQFYLDNDKFVPFGLTEDRDYTFGLALSYSSQKINKIPFHKMNYAILKKGWSFFHPKRDFVKKDFRLLSGSLEFWNMAFTPEDLAKNAPVFEDRPYASVLFFNTKVRLLDLKANQVHSLSISYGVLATPLPSFFQTIFHSIDTSRPIPEGWHNQIGHPWEPTIWVNYQRDRSWVYNMSNKPSVYFDARERLSLDLGSRNGISYSLIGRWGKKIENTGDVFLFLTVKPSFLAYDVMLEGQIRNSVHTLSARERRHFIGESGLGAGTSWKFKTGVLRANYGFYVRSPDAIYPLHKRNHYWGSFVLGWGF